MRKALTSALAAMVLAGLAGAVPSATGAARPASATWSCWPASGRRELRGHRCTRSSCRRLRGRRGGREVANDLSSQIGVLVARSS